MNRKKQKSVQVNTLKAFRTNDELYDKFAIRCRERKVKIHERLNDLILEDLSRPFPSRQSEIQPFFPGESNE